MACPTDVRSLFKDMPSREKALEAQKANLLRFVSDNAQEYDALPYDPFTRQRSRKFGVQTAIVASSLPGCVGLRGVALVDELITQEKEKAICYYPGLLITERLHAKFSRQYYCPTSLELQALTYQEPDESAAHPLLIIGDPTSHGAIINDGVRSHQRGKRI